MLDFLFYAMVFFGIFGAIHLIYLICITLFLPPGHKLNVIQRRRRWQMDHPGKKHPFKY